MTSIDPIGVQGLREFSRSLKKIDADLPKALRRSNNLVADIVVGRARPDVPTRSGRARQSIKARSTRTEVRVSAGGRRVPYYPWLDFGGRVGRDRSVQRRFITEGRYLYPAFMESTRRVQDVLVEQLSDLATQAGLKVVD